MAPEPAPHIQGPHPLRTHRIVVGIDGSSTSAAALRWAVSHAETAGAETMIDAVYAWRPPGGVPISRDSTAARADDEERARLFVVEAAGAALGAVEPGPAVEVHTRAEEGNPAYVLLTAATGAEMLVVGNKGHSLVADVVVGSVGIRCAARADCPVVLVPGPRR